MMLGFTGNRSIEFVVNQTLNSTVIGGPDATLTILNKDLTFTQDGKDIFTIDGNNEAIVMKEYGLTLLSKLNNNIDMNGNNLVNIANITDPTSVVNKTYVDTFFD